MRKVTHHIILLLVICVALPMLGQTTYPMQNITIGDCNGKFTDSDAGLKVGNYGHEEDFVLTICVPGATSIAMVFNSFCLENKNDSLEAFDGKNVTAKKIGGWTGKNGPDTVFSTGGCLTFRFRSDKSVACSGWDAEWFTSIKQVTAPVLGLSPAASCDDKTLVINMSQKVNCDTLKKYANYSLSGPNSPSITSFTPINCDKNNQTSEIRLNLSKGIDRSGSYKISYKTVVPDPCDSVWVFIDSLNFNVNDCPIAVDLTADNDTICKGKCTDITAVVTGGNVNKYTYSWNNGVKGTSPVTVCPKTTTTYILTVSDGASVPGKDTITIVVFDPPTLPNDTTVCRYNSPMDLKATPSGGTWSGLGILDPVKGTFDPSKYTKNATYSVYYSIGGGCMDSMRISVYRPGAGAANAKCPGSKPFWAYSYWPRGGTWTGANITPAGLITPTQGDSTWVVTYTWKGCSSNKRINIKGPKLQKKYDTICLSDPVKRMYPNPIGGIWRGKGVTNWYYCYFDPVKAGPGSHMLTYDMGDCSDTMYMYVVDIKASANEVTCPNKSPHLILPGTPSGGYWTGKGVTDSTTGLYDPSFTNSYYNDTLFYHIAGCTDSKMMYVRSTVIYKDTLKFCIEDTTTLLQWKSVQRSPSGGVWAGNGVSGNYFNPSVAGYGNHILKYTANTCVDSMVMVIHPQADIQRDTNLCIGNPPYKLFDASGKGTFYGTGITDNAKGIFDPATSGIGTFKIHYYSEFNCIDSLNITVDPLPTVSYTGLSGYYCFKDTNILLKGSPSGGVFTGPGIIDSFFNPQRAGSGKHSITYKYGDTYCSSSQTRNVNVEDTLLLTVSTDFDSICPGSGAQIVAKAVGGIKTKHNFYWSSGQGNVPSILVTPANNTTFTVTLTDGCSDPQVVSVPIYVHEKPNGSISTSPIDCYGEDGWAKISMLGTDDYSYEWNTNPKNYTDSVNAPVTSWYQVTATNLRTGCIFETTATIPGYSLISANFTTIPRGLCLNNLRPDLFVIDQSVGATKGTWDFGDGTIIPYVNNNPVHTYGPDTNKYRLTLIVENEGGCMDTAFVDICMDDSIVLFVPDAFSPTPRDNVNPTLIFRGGGLVEFSVQIFNRWGEIVYESNDITEEWDGTLNGNPCPQGLYGYRVIYKGKKTRYFEKAGGVYLFR